MLTPRTLDQREPLYPDECMACFFQRDGHLPYILRRYIHESSGPDPDYTFGHCLVCIQCPGNLFPVCHGWWPSDPAGADYEGDDGLLREDNAEKWHHGICQSIPRSRAIQSTSYLQRYADNNTYQVINQNGSRSCLGFCEDAAQQLDIDYWLPMGDLTIPGDMKFPRAAIRFRQTEPPFTPEDVMFMMVELQLWKGETDSTVLNQHTKE